MLNRALDCLAPADVPALPITALRPDGLATFLAGSPHAAYLQASGFAAAAGEIRLLPAADGIAGAVFGLGDSRNPRQFGALAASLPARAWRILPGDFDPADATLGFCLGAYQFSTFKAAQPAALLQAEPGDAAELARSVWLARDLINTPANVLGPAELAAALVAVAESFGAEATVVTGQTLVDGYPALAAVAAGSDRAPAVAILRWQGSGAGPAAPLISLCGKGVCFDTGGYDIKPSAGMLRMKKDMGGAAILLGVARAVMAADLPVRLVLRLGCVENSISGHAMRPSDVLRTRRGLTVEVGNTDAEGRLVLCDLLAEASDEQPDLLIDAATLTGAARTALGPDLPAMFCNDDAMAAAFTEAGLAAHDPVWRLPLWPGYEGWLGSTVADLNNVGSKPMAGAITAALFLQRFVTGSNPWIHLDAYAWSDSTTNGRVEGGEATGLLAFVALLRKLHPAPRNVRV